LIADYSSRFRLIEIWATWIFAALFAALAAREYSAPFSLPAGQAALIAVFGALFADLLSGLVHWAADTWGNQSWPIVGPTLIRSFREHHVDKDAITRHDFIETNGATALILLPVILGVHLSLPRDASAWTRLYDQGALFALSVNLCVFMTNQIHKWSHVERAPSVVRLLQNLRVILPATHHEGHHTGRHTSRYCITTGWLNPLLDRIRLFRALETAIRAISAFEPREDDLKLLRSSHSHLEDGAS
jgi:ubiquitin-conjugating enzyme E2 variant